LLALKIQEEMNDKKGVSQSFNNLGLIYSNMGDYKKAIDYYEKSLEIKLEINEPNGISLLYSNIALLYLTVADTLPKNNITEINSNLHSAVKLWH
jgi:tetratricopeptide (TPR) repeat protein